MSAQDDATLAELRLFVLTQPKIVQAEINRMADAIRTVVRDSPAGMMALALVGAD